MGPELININVGVMGDDFLDMDGTRFVVNVFGVQ
jgi:hypothetical protein